MSSDLLRSTVEPGDSGLELPRPALEAQDDVNMGEWRARWTLRVARFQR